VHRVLPWLATLLLLALPGCAERAPRADDATLREVAWREPGPASLTLYTMVNNRTGKGAHSSILINASERVIFDPAGSFQSDLVPQRDDVLFGITPRIEQAYRSSHARSTHHVLRQRIEVSPGQAEAAYRAALAYGPVPGAFCAAAASRVLAGVPGLDGMIRPTMFPTRLSEQMAAIPGVQEDRYREDREDGLAESLARANRDLAATQAQAQPSR